MPGFDTASYLGRIGQASVPATFAGLRDLQAAQLRSVPFENIEVLLGGTPDMDAAAIFDKTVHRGRGGYCFELNTLFGTALSDLGFSVRRTLARVRMGEPQGGPRSHLALQVAIDGTRYLADAGFGGPGAMTPLVIDTPVEQAVPNGRYRIVDDPVSGEKVVERWTGSGWFALYGFDDAWVGDMDITAANFLCATWDGSPFGSHLMLNGYRGSTRIGVFDRAVTVEAPDQTRRREFAGLEDFAETLVGEIGLKVAPAALERIWRRIGGTGEALKADGAA